MKNKIISIVSIILLFPSLQAGERYYYAPGIPTPSISCPAMPCPPHSVKFKSPYEENVDTLHASTDLKQLQEILDQNVSVDAEKTVLYFWDASFSYDNELITPLMSALHKPFLNPPKIKFLLQHQANPNAYSSPHKVTPLMIALNQALQENNLNTKNVIELLIQYGADPYQQDSDGHDAFWHAEKVGRPELAKFMENLIKERREIRKAARNAQQGRQVTGIVAEYLIGPVSPAEQKKKEEASELPKAPGGPKSTSNVEETELPEVE